MIRMQIGNHERQDDCHYRLWQPGPCSCPEPQGQRCKRHRRPLSEGSKSKKVAEEHGLKVYTVAEAVKQADITTVLIPDEKQADVYKTEIAPNLKPGSALVFALLASTSITSKTVPPADVDVFMVALKGPGHLVRRTYTEGSGVPVVFAVHQDAR